MSRCFFIGHRDAPAALQPQLEAVVEQHIIEYGVTEFVAGQYGAFDRMAAAAVLRAKEHHPKVRLLILLPYHPAERPVRAPKGYDGTFYPPGMERVPRRLAILRANRYALSACAFLIAYAPYPGNAKSVLEAARQREARGGLRGTALSLP